MMTNAEIRLGDEEATLTKNGKHLRTRILSPQGARFALASPRRKAPQNPNTGFRQLVVEHSESGMETRIAVLLSIKPLPIEVRELSSW
jgi:hypothetical protein